MDAKVANYARIYPWFSNMTTHFVVAHERFLSVYDVNIGDWNHIDTAKDGQDDESPRNYMIDSSFNKI